MNISWGQLAIAVVVIAVIYFVWLLHPGETAHYKGEEYPSSDSVITTVELKKKPPFFSFPSGLSADLDEHGSPADRNASSHRKAF